MSKRPSSNDQRSNTKNHNNAAYAADRSNRLNLGHAEVPPPPLPDRVPPPLSSNAHATFSKK